MGRIECALPLQGRAAAAARPPPEAPAGGEAAPRAERRAWARDAPQAPHGLSSMRILQGPSRRTESGTGTDGPRRQSDGGVDPLATAPRDLSEMPSEAKGRRSNATQWRMACGIPYVAAYKPSCCITSEVLLQSYSWSITITDRIPPVLASRGRLHGTTAHWTTARLEPSVRHEASVIAASVPPCRCRIAHVAAALGFRRR